MSFQLFVQLLAHCSVIHSLVQLNCFLNVPERKEACHEQVIRNVTQEIVHLDHKLKCREDRKTDQMDHSSTQILLLLDVVNSVLGQVVVDSLQATQTQK